MSLFIALDIGTSIIKIALFDEEGSLLSLATRESPLIIEDTKLEYAPNAC